jgi:hypothetical protein
MKIHYLRLLIPALSITVLLNAQQFQYTKVDFNIIKSVITSETSVFYYPRLYNRYQNNDTTMTVEEFRYLYYGFTFQDQYTPYDRLEAENSVKELLAADTLKADDFRKLYNSCKEILHKHPFSVQYLLTMGVACSKLGLSKEATAYYFKYDRILSAILSSGDGATEESAWCVIQIPDEYELVRALEFEPTGEQRFLSKSLCDFIFVNKNEYDIEGFYFDVSKPFSQSLK